MDLFSYLTNISFSLFAFILMIVIVVGFHEFGHFITARLLGIKVLTFSIGMGKKVLTWTSKKSGIEYAISLLPFGGYVKMLDESDKESIEQNNYSQKDLEKAFNRAPLWKRFLVVFNGPLFNLILAIAIFWGINMNGVTYPKPIVGNVEVSSWASETGFKPGDKIIKVEDNDTVEWKEVVFGMIDQIGQDDIEITVLRSGQEVTLTGDMAKWELERKDRDLLGKVGLIPAHANLLNVVYHVAEETPAAKYGIQKGDKIIKIANIETNSFADISKVVKTLPNENVNILVDREGSIYQLIVKIGENKLDDGSKVGFLGVSPAYPAYNPDNYETRELGPWDSLTGAVDQSIYMVEITAGFVKKLFTGDLSPKLISGPVTMADSAGQSASYGVVAFLSFCALISINLMIMNLLPVPGLDGGHLAMYVIEAFRRKTLSESAQEWAMRVGMVSILSLMAFAVIMDILDLFS